MKMIFGFLVIAFTALHCGNATQHDNVQSLPAADSSTETPAAFLKLKAAYPDFVAEYKDNYVYFKDGNKMLWDDGLKKNNQQLLDEPDLEDQFHYEYRKGKLNSPPAKNEDAGRIRHDALFQKMYGKTQAEVRNHLTEITWCPRLVNSKLKVTTVNGVAEQLKKISAELDEHPELKPFIQNIGGTFNWRLIAGSNRISGHSYGMTIDINTKFSNYWQWDCKCTDENRALGYKNRVPQLLIDIFEKHGFIWGGKWCHYDTMHFEYRPELL